MIAFSGALCWLDLCFLSYSAWLQFCCLCLMVGGLDFVLLRFGFACGVWVVLLWWFGFCVLFFCFWFCAFWFAFICVGLIWCVAAVLRFARLVLVCLAVVLLFLGFWYNVEFGGCRFGLLWILLFCAVVCAVLVLVRAFWYFWINLVFCV